MTWHGSYAQLSFSLQVLAASDSLPWWSEERAFLHV